MEIPENLEQLLLHKSFVELSSKEKEYVLTLLPEEEYRQQHLILTLSVKALNSNEPALFPPDKTRQILKQAFKEKHKKESFRSNVFEKYHFGAVVYPALFAVVIIMVLIYIAVQKPGKTKNLALVTTEGRVAEGKSNISSTNPKQEIISKNEVPERIKSIPVHKKYFTRKPKTGSTNKKYLAAPDLIIPKDTITYLCYDIRIEPKEMAAAMPCIDTRLIVPEGH